MISLVGVSTTTLLWLALGVGGVISVLYLLRLRRRQVIVPFLPLWQKVLQQSQYQSLWQRLRRLLSWLLQMLLLLLLLLALANPRLRAELFSGRNVVVILDISASMKSLDGRKISALTKTGQDAKESKKPEPAPEPIPKSNRGKLPTPKATNRSGTPVSQRSRINSRMEEAKEHAHKLIRSLVGHDQLMLVSMDAEVVPRTPFTSDQSLLRKALDQLQPSDTKAQLKRALWLAQDALFGRKMGEIVVISDGAYGSDVATLLSTTAQATTILPKQPGGGQKASRKRTDSHKTTPKTNSARTDDTLTNNNPIREPQPNATGKTTQKPPVDRQTETTQEKPKMRKVAVRHNKKRTRRRRATRSRRPHRRTRATKRRVRRGKGRQQGKKTRSLAKHSPQSAPLVLPAGVQQRLDIRNSIVQQSVERKLPPFRWIKVGQHADNVGIVALSARRRADHPLQFSVYVELHNFGQQPVEGFLELYVGDLVMETMKVTLRGQERWRRIIPNLTAQGQKLTARLKITRGKDLLPSDNQAFAVLPKAEALRVLLVSEDNLYLQAALLSDPQLVMEVVKCGKETTVKKPFDVAIYHQCEPTIPTNTGRFLFFDPPAKGTPFSWVMRRGEFVYNKEVIVTEQNDAHPIMHYLAFQDINIQRAKKFAMKSGDSSLVSTFGQPLIVARQTKALRAVAVGYSLQESDMVLRVVFPLFLRNTLQWLQRGGRSVPPTSWQTGGIWQISVPEQIKQVSVISPDGRSVTLPARDGVVLFSGKQNGFYRVQQPPFERWVAANLADPEESRIQPGDWKQRQGKTEPSSPSLTTGFRILGILLPIPRPIWLYLLLLVVVLLVLEWITYNRRITV